MPKNDVYFFIRYSACIPLFAPLDHEIVHTYSYSTKYHSYSTKNVSFVKRYIHNSLLFKTKLGRVDHDPPHLPHGHLAVVGVRVVVPLDRRQVRVEVEEYGR